MYPLYIREKEEEVFLTLKFFDEYKNNDFLKDKYSSNIAKEELPSNIEEVSDPIKENKNK